MGKNCKQTGCPGCQWKCNCDYRCYKCSVGNRMSCMESSWTNWNFDAPRKKFVCFNCKKILKSSWTKNTFEEMTHADQM